MSGPGGRANVEAPLHAGPTVGLLASADPVIDQNDALQRWLNGVVYEPMKCTGGQSLALGCATGSASVVQTKVTDANEAARASDPFLVVVGEKCSTIGWEARDFAARAMADLTAMESMVVEREFWTGAAAKAGVAAGVSYSGTQWLAQATSSTTVAGGALKPVAALSAIARELSSQGAVNGEAPGGGSRAMIHVPWSVLVHWVHNAVVRRDGNRYYDPFDNIVVPGVGYTGTSPAGANPSAGTAWVYVTSQVRFWRTEPEILPGSYAEATNHQTNTIEFRAERMYLLDWDHCVHLAVLVDLPTDE